MFSIKDVPSTTSILSAYAAFTATTMLVRTAIDEVQNLTNQTIPKQIKDMISSKFGGLYGNRSRMTFTIDESNGYSRNQLYEASVIYLQTKINPSLNSLTVSKSPKENNFSLTMSKGEKIVDVFEGVQLLWVMGIEETDETSRNGKLEKRVIKLSFHKKYMEKVLSSYLSIYDLELASVDSNSEFRRLLVSTSNRSILVIEDIDCSIKLQNRRSGRTLVSNYLGINNHNLFLEIDELMTEVQVTPAAIAEELMKNEDADIALDGLIKFLQRKKIEVVEDEARDNKRKTMSADGDDQTEDEDGDDQTEDEDGDYWTEDEDGDDQHNFINNCKRKKMRVLK
ncbi:hypothetical protein Dsin_010631 [Dipteronia sinensis]|uniref:AAA-type ATPase N-terminal domain-containing protein n=1 Tax=Dipteronia sinensis TaxID=43782 RepID=A0AAE0ASW4_9ROSI|nr:hypothetical protein Dsin_010631 [Dipteronia sinensis]